MAVIVVQSVGAVAWADSDKKTIGSDKQTGGPTPSDAQTMNDIKQRTAALKQQSEAERKQRQQQQKQQQQKQQAGH